jgi:dTDP-D-glucose 4,6-dehydratase
MLDKPESLITFVVALGHDRRHAMDTSRMSSALGWRRAVSFAEGPA